MGFVASSLTMMAFEFANSLLFPFPADLDTQSLEQVRAYAIRGSQCLDDSKPPVVSCRRVTCFYYFFLSGV